MVDDVPDATTTAEPPRAGVPAPISAFAATRPVETAERITEHLRDRAAEHPEDHTWITTTPPDALRRQAAELERRPDRDRLPLFGVPFAVKDNIDVAGMPTTAGCPDFAYVPMRTATAVARLMDAGALLVGKTNLDQFATGLSGTRSPYGACESVYGRRLIAGGSSSGSAVAVAAALVAFSLGTDTAGSGRVPAAMNGIVGLKPTRGLVSTTGVVPACRSLDCVSVFARDAGDVSKVLNVIAAHDPTDPWSRRPRAARPTLAAGHLRVGIPDPGQLDFFGDEQMAAGFGAARARAEAFVDDVVPIDLDPFLEAGELLYQGPWLAERLAGLEAFLASHPESVLGVTRAVLEGGRRFSAIDAHRARLRLQELRAGVESVWGEIDVLLLPTVGTTFTIEQMLEEPYGRNATLGRYTMFANLLDLSAIAVPAGDTTDGRPAGIQLIGPAWSEATLLGLATALAAPASPGPQRQQPGAADGPDTVTLAVVGLHLRGEPRNHELVERGGRLLETTSTAASYRLFLLGTAGKSFPGLVRCRSGGAPIEVELWAMPVDSIGGLLAGIGAPLGLGRLRLADGRDVIGFLCEAVAADVESGALDITASGGWRAHRSTAG